jgi:DNA polymerase-3 subunit alpha
MHALDAAFEMGLQAQQDKRAGQMNFFGASDAIAAPQPPPPPPDVPEFPSADLLKFEKELLGFYITSHPLTEHQAAIERYTTATTRECMNLTEGVELTLGGMINRVKKSVTKTGRSAGMPMAMITIEDLEGQIDGVLFADTLGDVVKRYPEAVSVESIVFVRGRIDRRRETPCVVVTDVIPVSESIGKLTTGIALKLDESQHPPDLVPQIKPLLQQHRGNVRVYLQIATRSQKVVLQLGKDFSVRPAKQLVEDLQTVLGSGSVQLIGDGMRRQKRLEQQKLFKEEASVESTPVAPTSDEALTAQIDEELVEDE